jgi:hypothetical protein
VSAAAPFFVAGRAPTSLLSLIRAHEASRRASSPSSSRPSRPQGPATTVRRRAPPRRRLLPSQRATPSPPLPAFSFLAQDLAGGTTKNSRRRPELRTGRSLSLHRRGRHSSLPSHRRPSRSHRAPVHRSSSSFVVVYPHRRRRLHRTASPRVVVELRSRRRRRPPGGEATAPHRAGAMQSHAQRAHRAKRWAPFQPGRAHGWPSAVPCGLLRDGPANQAAGRFGPRALFVFFYFQKSVNQFKYCIELQIFVEICIELRKCKKKSFESFQRYLHSGMIICVFPGIVLSLKSK